MTKLIAAGSNLIYSTFLGGRADDEASGIVVDSDGNAHIAGSTWSKDFPTTPDAFDGSFNGKRAEQTGKGDAFYTKLNASGSALVYSTFIGGTERDEGHFLALDTAGSAYITGHILSDNLPANEDCYDPTFNGNVDSWIVKLP